MVPDYVRYAILALALLVAALVPFWPKIQEIHERWLQAEEAKDKRKAGSGPREL